MSESNNNIPMRITQLEEAETFDYESYLAEAKAGSGTKKVKGSTLLAELIDVRQGADGVTYPTAGDAVRAQARDLKSAIKNIDLVYNFEVTSGNSYYLPVDVIAGTSFKVVNNTSDTLGLGAYDADKTTRLEPFTGTPANSNDTYTFTYNTPYLLCYARASGSINIEIYTGKLHELETEIASIENNIGEVYNLSAITGYSYWINIPIELGKTYSIINNSNNNINCHTYAQDQSTRIEMIGQITPNERRDFTATSNAYYLLVYCGSASSGTINVWVNGTISGDIANINNETNKRDKIIVGIGGDYQTVHDGIVAAIAEDVPLVILPGEYDLVQEGINGLGYWLPRVIYGYGAVIKCELAVENWDLSAFNVHPARGAEVYGLTVICENCRYCIHDEMDLAEPDTYYHNIFKDLTLVHKSDVSSTLLAPQCIGGGLGDKGYIEINNCVFNAKIRDVSYHSLATSPQRDQTGDCIVKITNCYFEHKPTCQAIGESTNYMNKMYVSNCSVGETVTSGRQANIEMIAWNNPVRAL